MGYSLKEIYSTLIDKGEFNSKLLNKYQSLNELKKILNSMNEYRSASIDSTSKIPVRCNEHENFDIDKLDKLSLKDISNKIKNIKTLGCASKQVDICTCQSLISCECDSRILTCDKVVFTEPDKQYQDKQVPQYYCTCDSKLIGYTCTCQSRVPNTTTVCSCNSRTESKVYNTSNVCTCNLVGSESNIGLPTYTCSCNSVSDITGYSFSTYVRSYTLFSEFTYNPKYDSKYDDLQTFTYEGSNTYVSNTIPADVYQANYNKVTVQDGYYYVSECSCNTRTSFLGCLCNTRSESLCASRSGCSCNTVCDCNTVKLFE